jgi:hypothetical protein
VDQPPSFGLPPTSPPSGPRGYVAAAPRTNRTRLLVVAAVAAVALLVAGTVYLLTSGTSAAEQGSASVPAELKIGDSVELTNSYGDRVEITITAAEARTTCGPSARKPETGGYLVADVTVEVKSGRATVRSTDFDFGAGGWPHRDLGPEFTGCGGTALGTLDNARDGTKHQGVLVFDVSPAEGRIAYHVSSGTTPLGAQWKVG